MFLIALKQCDRVWEYVDIVSVTCQALSILVDHRRRSNRVEVIYIYIRRAFNVEDHSLASLAVADCGAGCVTNISILLYL